MHASSVLVWNIIEICVLCFTFYIFNVQSKLRTLDLIAYCGYKYVGMIAALSSYLLTHSLFVYRCSLLYVSLSLSYFLVRKFIEKFRLSKQLVFSRLNVSVYKSYRIQVDLNRMVLMEVNVVYIYYFLLLFFNHFSFGI